MQDAITDYGLGRSQFTQPNYYQPQQPYYPQEPYYQQQQTERRFQQPMYESNNPAYNYLTGEPFTEAELLEMGLDRFGQPLEKKQTPIQTQSQPSRTVSKPQQPTQPRVSQNQRPPLQPRVPRPPKDVSNMTTQEKFDALERGSWF